MKKFIGLILAALLLVTALPIAVFATPSEHEISVGEEISFFCTSENKGDHIVAFTITEDGVYHFAFEHEIYEVCLYQKSGEEYVMKDSARNTNNIYFRMEAGEYYIDIYDNFNSQNRLQLNTAGDLQSFSLYRDYCIIPVGEAMIISYKASPSTVLIDKISYFSDDEDLIEITEHGGIIAKKTGRATLSLTAVDVYGNKITDSMEIIVTDIINWDVSKPITLTAGGNIIQRDLEFTVDETGVYEIYSIGGSDEKGIDPEARLFLGEKQIGFDYDTYNKDFSIKYNLVAGETYKLIVSNGGNIPKEFTVNIRTLAEDYANKPVCETVNLTVGEEHEVKFTNQAIFTLSTTQTDVVEIKENTIVAKAEGTATVTATLGETTAEINVTVAPVKELAINTVTDIVIDDTCVKRYFKFTAPEDGEYVFYATGNADNYGELYNSEGISMGYNDDTSGYNFVIVKECIAGGIYYLETSNLWRDHCNYQIVVAKATTANSVNMLLSEKDYITKNDDTYLTYNTVESIFFNYVITFGDGLGATPTEYSLSEIENPNGDLTVYINVENRLQTSLTVKFIENIYADINLDGVLDASDYELLNGYLQSQTELTAYQLIIADVNGDMVVDNADLEMLAVVICERFTHTPVFNAEGNKILVSCQVEGIPCTDNHTCELTLVAEGGEYDGTPYFAAALQNITSMFPDVEIGAIYYEGVGDTVYEATTQEPANVGTYRVTITVGGVTAETELVITEAEVKYTVGDINGNGKLDARDYLLLKRAYFGTYKLDETEVLASDINGNGKIDARDYLLLKRAYFGTYTIK